MNQHQILRWLSEGDVSVRYQLSRDLLADPPAVVQALQERIATEGWGARFLQHQNVDGHWGNAFYQPKWTCTHYTLLDLKAIGLSPRNEQAMRAVELVLQMPEGKNGGIPCSEDSRISDICVNGMVLNYASWFLPGHCRLHEITNYLLKAQMADGGWNCAFEKKTTTHGSFHSTLSVLEGLLEFRRMSTGFREAEIIRAEQKAVRFLLLHRLYKSHRTGETVDPRMLMLSFPCRWRYDILRVLDYLQSAAVPFDSRMLDALQLLKSKRRNDGTWPVQHKHPGQVHFDMEKTGTASRWNTLRALRVFKFYPLPRSEADINYPFT